MFFTVNFRRKMSTIIMIGFFIFIGLFGYFSIYHQETATVIPVVNEEEKEEEEEKKAPIYSVETDQNKLAISFDAAWGA
ncbi:hypothetical protein [Natranaerobius thermophilus]|uniref:Polysaccharide deacetylase n=1 Tax=Natranaerobius thermophilus (strain ATCC BAA-1301 / DSM 18059 / JW/NM-WN-LF) TaxID=457570 RepID=B2A5P3_NATTJ|nr:hypothetical protein [Natranaerobius thermophilus]ACB83991.1 polysaccharide deacetylase [Natranaerobius thermophilus JW/NM-WN-LF]